MKKKRAVFVLMFLLLFFLIIYIGINAYSIFSFKGKLYELSKAEKDALSADAILVLGAGVRSDGTPSKMLEDRLLTALELYENKVCDKIIVSGDHGSESYDEVNVMKKYLVEKGVRSEDVFMDHAGFSTYDSLYRAKAVFGAKSLVVVTQKYHAYRSLMIGRSLGIECSAVAAPILSSDAKGYSRQGWYSFRESFARCKDFLYCVFKPEPKYLGETISLNASGDVTNDKK